MSEHGKVNSNTDGYDDQRLTDADLEHASYRYPEGKGFLAPFVMSLIALVLGLFGQTLPLLGLIVGAAALALKRISGVPRNDQKAPRATTAIAVLGMLLSLGLSFYHPQPGTITFEIDAPDWQASYGTISVEVTGELDSKQTFDETLEVTPNEPYLLDDYATGSYTFVVATEDLEQDDERFELIDTSATCQLELEKDVEATIRLALVPRDGKLTLALSGTHIPSDTQQATINVSGTQPNGEPFTDTFMMTFGATRVLYDYGEGDYTFSIDPNSFTLDDTVYTISPQQCSFNEYDDVSVNLVATVDTQATQQLAEQRAAERAAERAAAEAAAAAEAQRQREAAQQPTELTVYITDTGAKYHMSGCRYLRQSSHPISLSAAKAQGYTACKVCDPPS